MSVYRDDLAAAHARIGVLERRLARYSRWDNPIFSGVIGIFIGAIVMYVFAIAFVDRDPEIADVLVKLGGISLLMGMILNWRRRGNDE